jgi:hypothetical protein
METSDGYQLHFIIARSRRGSVPSGTVKFFNQDKGFDAPRLFASRAVSEDYCR